MPYYVNTDQGVLAGRGDVQPSASLSFAGAVGSALTGNLTSVIADYGELQQANKGPRLGKAQADQMFKDAGIRHSAPESGYTQSAIDIIIKRQRNQQAIRDIDEATPYSWVGTPIRGGASVLAGLTDPLNVASAFIPVVREARVASMLARAGESGLSSALARGAIGATEGLVGSALMEVPTYGLRTALQDDYTLTDSLLNMAFGTVAGGGLHAVGGAIGDHLSGGNPYSRFAGLGTKEIRQVLDFEAGRVSDTSAFTALQKRAAGLSERETVPVSAIEDRIEQRAPIERQLPDQSVLSSTPDAPFQRLYELTPEQAYRTAGERLRDDFRAELLGVAGQKAEPGVIAQAKSQIATLEAKIETLSSREEFKRRYEQAHTLGRNREKAQGIVKAELNQELSDISAQRDRLQGVVDRNAEAAKAEQQLAKLDNGEVPEQFSDRVSEEAQRIQGAGEIARAITGTSEPPAAFVIGMAQPETREAAMRTALANFANGRMPDVDALVRSDPTLIGNRSEPREVSLSAARQRDADSAYLGSRESAEAATAKQKEGPLDIEAEVQSEVARLNDMVSNLEANGLSREALDKITNLAAFDDEVKRAKAIGEVSRIGAICGIRT